MADLELVDISDDPELIRFSRAQSSETWKGRLSQEEYIIREKLLNSCPVSEDMRVYMLQDNDTGAKLSSVDIIFRDGVVYDLVDGEVVKRSVKSGCISSVYTFKHHRSKGYARVMTDKLVEKCKDLLGDGFIFLYSEVGEYYSKSGFKSDHIPVIEISEFGGNDIFTHDATRYTVPEGELELVEFLGFSELMEQYRKDKEREIESKVKQDGITRVAITPNSDYIDWFHLRAKYQSYRLHYPQAKVDHTSAQTAIEELKHIEPLYFGLKLNDSFIIWTVDFASEGDSIKVIVVHGGKERLLLIEYLKQYAAFTGGIKKIEVWTNELPGHDWSTLGKVTENSSLSAIQMADLREHEKLVEGRVIWEINNKLPWC